MTTEARGLVSVNRRQLSDWLEQALGCAENHYGENPEGGYGQHIEEMRAALTAAPKPVAAADLSERARVALRREPQSCSCFNGGVSRGCVGVCEDAVEQVAAALATVRAEGVAAAAQEIAILEEELREVRAANGQFGVGA